MYFALSPNQYYLFEFIAKSETRYLNRESCEACSEEERQKLLDLELFVPEDFLLIPQINRDELVIKFILKINCKSFLERVYTSLARSFAHQQMQPI
ncbi:MAG: hypothetical protein LBS74_11335 [Oscillospiraceae bacterium]|jgi:hypothetical protein|nr:hypothetical protein [Oscillospiraceae bacterium]